MFLCSFDNISGTNQHGQPNDLVPEDILASIKRNGVCLKGTLFTPLDRSTSTQSLNVQVKLQRQHYDHIVMCTTNKDTLLLFSVAEVEAQYWCVVVYQALDQTLVDMQMRKRLDTYANLVHGFSMPGLKTRHDNIDIVVIR